jgi:hypothetical protein
MPTYLGLFGKRAWFVCVLAAECSSVEGMLLVLCPIMGEFTFAFHELYCTELDPSASPPRVGYHSTKGWSLSWSPGALDSVVCVPQLGCNAMQHGAAAGVFECDGSVCGH